MTLQGHTNKGSGDFMEVPLWDIVYLNPPKIDSHKYCVSTYIIILVFHVILQDKMIT